MNKNAEFGDFLSLFSLYIGFLNLTENEQQNEAQLKMLRQNDVNTANDKQAAYLLAEFSKQMEEQNQKLDEILKLLKQIRGE